MDGLETIWNVNDECVAQWPNGLFYQAKIIRVLKDNKGVASYAVQSDDVDDTTLNHSNQLRKMGDRPVIRVGRKVEEAKTEEIVAAALKQHKTKVPEGAAVYMASLSLELVNRDRCLDIDSWYHRLSPVMKAGLGLKEPLVWKVCNTIIKRLVPMVGYKEGETRRKSSEAYRKEEDCLLHISKLTLGYMGKILLIRTVMHLNKGHRYGVVGENGAGKTTLMRKIASGTLPGFPKWIKTVYVQPDFDSEHDFVTAYDYLTNAQREEQGEDCDVSVVDGLMADLQFTDKLKNSLIKELSGGWKMRVSLARATMQRADILLLDEPTNHLDVTAVKWLETYLRSISTTVLVISHEPAFLDRVTTDILFMKNQKLNHYKGNFTAFCEQQAGFSSRDLEDSAMSGPSDALRFRFPDPGELVGINSRTRAVMNVKDCTFAYDPKRGNVLKGVKARLSLSSRVAVVGPNGAGKSTLVKLMVGELEPQTGTIWRHLNLRISYVAQHSFDHLEKVKNKPALAYIRNRFVRGFDSENAAYKGEGENDEHKATDRSDYIGRTVEAILGRRKFKNSVAYEVKWEGFADCDNTWETEMRLREIGVAHLARQCDEKIRSKKSGIDQRPLTNKEITRHLGDFGLDKQYANAKIEGLSGGQKCKLVLAGAMWNKPHMLVLDEPTNYLDLDALGALALAINKYKGGIIMVSHNKDFIGEICQEQWNVGEGVIKNIEKVVKPEKEVIETCELPDAKDRGYDGKEAAAKAAAIKAAALPVGVGKLLGPLGLESESSKERANAVDELLTRQSKTNFGGKEARERVFRSCLTALRDIDDEVWSLVLKLGRAIAATASQEELEPLLGQVKTRVAELKSSANNLTSSAEETKAAADAEDAAKWRIGEKVLARYGDGQWYSAEVVTVYPRGQGFMINYVEYGEQAKLKCEDVKRSSQPVTRQAPVNKEASALAGAAQLENRARAGVLVLKSAIVLRLDSGAHKEEIVSTVKSTIEVLSTTSPATQGMTKASDDKVSVHEALSQSLPSLLALDLGLDSQALLTQCLDQVVNATDAGVRAGAAYCLAALLKGFGPEQIRSFKLLDKLSAMLTKDAAAHERTAALLLYPRLFYSLGSVIEYKVTDFLPALLLALRDRNKEVSKAAKESSRILMASLSIHGARLVLPILIKGLEAKDWKTKVNNVQVLEAVSYCSEELMAEQLPTIVPKLMEVMSSPRKEVQKAAEKAFDQIGSIIANPEIAPLVPHLLKAVRDATKHTQDALEKLTHTSFAYAVDSPSLALLMPIVFNGMKDRKIECKKAAMKVIDALCSLIMDVKYLAPYAADLLKRLKVYLVYSMPDVRAVAARALGTLYSEMGEEFFPNLLKHLVDGLKVEDVSPHEIAGTARGLCYCAHALGIERTKQLLPNLVKETKSDIANVRVGHYELFVVMPEVFADNFRIHFFKNIFPVVLAGVSDGVLSVQEAAMAASQELVSRHARTDLQFMLPHIMNGVDSKDAKIRTCFLQLIGTLFLNMVIDTNFSQTVKFWGHGNQLAEDEIANTATAEQLEIITKAFTEQVRNDTFAKLYLMRSDDSEGVGQMAWRVWHLVVPHERDLLMILLAMLIDDIVKSLQDESNVVRTQGRKSLGHLVLTLGNEGLARIVPMLHKHLESEDWNTRKAVCSGFAEIMRTAGKEDIGQYLNDIIPSVRDLLIDPVAEVRPAAGAAFAQLYKNVGSKAIDRIVPLLIDTLREGKHTESLVDGIKVVLSKCEMNGYFNLLQRILSSLKETQDKDSVDYHMRECLVMELCRISKTGEGMELVRAFKALQQFSEEMPSCKTHYFQFFLLNAVNRYMDTRGNIRSSSRQLLFYACGFNEDQEAGKALLDAFCADKDVRKDTVAEICDVMSTHEGESLANAKFEDVEDEKKASANAGATGGKAQNVAQGDEEVLGKDEKRCATCKKRLKVKSFSKKQFKHVFGNCKMCA